MFGKFFYTLKAKGLHVTLTEWLTPTLMPPIFPPVLPKEVLPIVPMAKGLHVTLTEWLTLQEALSQGLCNSSLTDFYHISNLYRLLIHDMPHLFMLFVNHIGFVQPAQHIFADLISSCKKRRRSGDDKAQSRLVKSHGKRLETKNLEIGTGIISISSISSSFGKSI